VSFAVWNWMKVYARWRETYLSAYPEKRLFTFSSQDTATPDNGEQTPFIHFTSEFKEKIGISKWVLALVAVVLLASNRK